MSKSRATRATFAVGAICTIFANTAYAAEVKVSGTNTHVIVSNDSQKLNDGRTLLHLHDKGIVEEKDPKSPFHLAMEDCFYTVILDTKGGISGGGGYCNAFDKDGDGWLVWWHFAPDSNKWNVFYGTGKFEGMTGGGTSKPIVNFDDRYNLTYEGTLTMK